MVEENEAKRAVWELKFGNVEETLKPWELKEAAKKGFKSQSSSATQKLVYDLLEAAKNKDQNRFFYLLLKSVNKPKENFMELWEKLEKYYDLMPEDAFTSLAYSIIIGIMSTYSNKKEGGDENERE